MAVDPWRGLSAAELGAWRRYRDQVVPVLHARQAGRCALCGWPVDLDLPGSDRAGAAVDHVHALAMGGPVIPASIDGVRLVHAACNTARSNRSRRYQPATPRPPAPVEHRSARRHAEMLDKIGRDYQATLNHDPPVPGRAAHGWP